MTGKNHGTGPRQYKLNRQRGIQNGNPDHKTAQIQQPHQYGYHSREKCYLTFTFAAKFKNFYTTFMLYFSLDIFS